MTAVPTRPRHPLLQRHRDYHPAVPPTDADPYALRAALAGDADAWAGIVEEFSDTMWGWARSAGLSREDAADVCQTVWYLLKDRGHTIREPERLAGWLAITTRREAHAVSRRVRTRQPEVIDVTDAVLPDPSAGPEAHALATETQTRLAQAFRSLSERCRSLLALLWDDNVSYADISEILDMPMGSIGPTRQRCLAKLRAEAVIA